LKIAKDTLLTLKAHLLIELPNAFLDCVFALSGNALALKED
jgi:hypothetical protein